MKPLEPLALIRQIEPMRPLEPLRPMEPMRPMGPGRPMEPVSAPEPKRAKGPLGPVSTEVPLGPRKSDYWRSHSTSKLPYAAQR